MWREGSTSCHLTLLLDCFISSIHFKLMPQSVVTVCKSFHTEAQINCQWWTRMQLRQCWHGSMSEPFYIQIQALWLKHGFASSRKEFLWHSVIKLIYYTALLQAVECSIHMNGPSQHSMVNYYYRDIDKIEEDQYELKTKKSTVWAMSVLKDWLVEKNMSSDFF